MCPPSDDAIEGWQQRLRANYASLATKWFMGLEAHSPAVASDIPIEPQLAALADSLCAMMLASDWQGESAEQAGSALMQLGYSCPEILAITRDVWLAELEQIVDTAALPDALKRLILLLSALSVGFCRAIQHDATQPPSSSSFFEHTDLAARDNRLRSIFDSVYLGVGCVDLAGNVVAVNHTLQTMLGYSEAELCGRSLNAYTHPGDAKLAQDLLEELRTGQRRHYHLEKRYLTKDGGTLWARLTAFLVDDDSFGQPFIVGILEDITSHKHKELEMGEMKRSLAEARDNERLMLAQELHDGPVQHLLGVSYQMEALTRRIATRQMLTEKEVGAQPPFLSELELLSAYVIDSVRQLRGLIGELRPAGLLELGLTAAIEGFVARLEYEQPLPLPAITLALDESGRHMPEPIALCIFRVAQEAIRNAVRHAQAATVSVSLQIRAQIVVLRVYDNGRGFEVPANMNELTRQDHFGVAGMIERVHVLNGQCHITSEPVEGTEILVWLEY